MIKYDQLTKIYMRKKLLRIRQAADMLGVTPLTLRRWDKNGTLKSIRVGTRNDRRYDPVELSRLIKKRKI